MSDRIKVVGYSQKVFYNDQIEYRNFSPDLVGLQLASDGGTPLFTMGSFAITTNFDPKISKNFNTVKFSNFVSLTDLNLTLESALSLLTNNAGVILNLDKSVLSNYALFGSFKEYVRVSLENIIKNWPAALYINPIYQKAPDFITFSSNTFEDYTYDSLTDKSTFKISTNVINNLYQINFLQNGNLQGTINESNTLRDLTTNYTSYSILYNNNEYGIFDFTGSTNLVNDYIYFLVDGNPFLAASPYSIYHIKPNKIKENSFFNALPNFDYYLLNRLTTPIYTSKFSFTIKSDGGSILYTNDSFTWPTTDGYNLDFDTDEYIDYATKLLDVSTNFDLTTSNLMVRFLVTESITDFDTTAVHLNPLDEDTSDQKMNKTLMIYGREFDDINQFISGIKFANVVSYNKQNNTPDIYLKNIARILGWDLISSVLENNLLKNYIEPSVSTYSGQSVGLTAVEADIELWRRIILNTPWIWKSKGTRKAIEFMFKFIGTPLGLISFNEYIYLSENKIDIDVFQEALRQNNKSTTLSDYPVGDDGYPLPLPNTPSMYFQNKGLWYRETGGSASTIDITSGNNPHVGPYDGGYKYMNQFAELIPNFSAVTISSATVTTGTTNLFNNYNRGTMTDYSGATYVDILNQSGVDFSSCFVVDSSIILDPKHRKDESDCGCQSTNTLKSLSICINKTNLPPKNCKSEVITSSVNTNGYYDFKLYQYNLTGGIYMVNGTPIPYATEFIDKSCCKRDFNGTPYYYEKYLGNGTATSPFTFVNTGYICCTNREVSCGCFITCNWVLNSPITHTATTTGSYLLFKTPSGEVRMTSQDGCNCVKVYTVAVPLTASTTDIGFGCQLTKTGLDDIAKGTNSILYQTYLGRSLGDIACKNTYVPPIYPKIFGVVLNGTNEIGGRVNNLEYYVVNSPNSVTGSFNTFNTPLSATPIGYYYGYQGNTSNSPVQGNTVRMQISKSSNYSNSISIKPEMYYLISNVEYNSTTFQTQINGLNRLNVGIRTTRSGDYYFSDFNYNPTINQKYIYMVFDFTTYK